jgi:hypothetical protein
MLEGSIDRSRALRAPSAHGPSLPPLSESIGRLAPDLVERPVLASSGIVEAVARTALPGPASIPVHFDPESKLVVADLERHGPGLLAVLREFARLGQT